MKVAIVGTGLSGLAAAHEFYDHGIIPQLFEGGTAIGGKLDFPAIVLKMYIGPYGNPFKYLKDKYNINIHPQQEIKGILIASQNKELYVKGNFGYILSRPPYYDSIDNQIFKGVNVPVTYNTLTDTDTLMSEFDYVVYGISYMTDVRKYCTLSETFHGHVRIANVLGNFDPQMVKIWFNTEYAKNGYAYLVPLNERDARIILIVNNISAIQLDAYWNQFLTTENIQYKIYNIRDLEHVVGNVNPIQYKNLYFVGNAAGMLDSFMGFGALRAIISGVTAARSIIHNLNYNKLMMPYIKDNWKKYEFRKAFNFLTDNSIDKIVTLCGMPLVKLMTFNNPLYKMTYATPIVKMINKLKFGL